jgi:PKD repeat protein
MAFDASSNAFSNYSGGILTESGTNVDHAVVFVGYVDSAAAPGGGYWIVRNSWGSGWGLNGYFYLSYGSDACGTDAEYLVYKGGIPYAVPPVADFTAAVSTSCSSAPIQFNDASTSAPTSWLWNFGDGGTSTLQNPTHSYTASGTYAVSLQATNQYGNNTATKNSYITINLAQAPVGTNGNGTSGSSVTLNASGSTTLNWYDAATGGNLVGTGTSYTTPTLTATTTYYVESDITQPAQTVGMLAKTTNGGYYTSTSAWGLIFNALNDVTINTVDVYAGAAVTVNIWVQNSSGTTISTVSKSLVMGHQTVTLNFNVPAGTGYELGSDGGCNLWRETTGATFPYTVSNLISITGNPVPDALHYYYFYNWQVSAPACSSVRIPVIANISGNGIYEYSETSNLNIYPVPASSSFDITPKNINFQNGILTIVNMLGQRFLEKQVADNNPIHVDASDFPQGIYLVELKTNNLTYVRKVTIAR